MTCDVFHDRIDGGLEPQGISEMGHLYGGNVIEIIVPPIYKMILKEVSNPFYMFQLYTVIVWMAQKYFDYSSLVIATTIVTVSVSVYETRKVWQGSIFLKLHTSFIIVLCRYSK